MDAMFTILWYIYGFAIGDRVPLLEYFDLDGHKKIITKAVETLIKYHDVEINNRVEMWRNGGICTKEDILDVLISLKDSKNEPLLSIQEIKAQVNVSLRETSQSYISSIVSYFQSCPGNTSRLD